MVQGNLFEAKVEALVNAVNTVGVMGKGIALLFKQRFPENYHAYAAACSAGKVRVGEMFITAGGELNGPRWIIKFPTKQHWRQPSQLEWVRDGLLSLKEVIREKNIKSIALPALGCGNGGLDWAVVRPLIETSLADLPGVEILLFEPVSDFRLTTRNIQ